MNGKNKGAIMIQNTIADVREKLTTYMLSWYLGHSQPVQVTAESLAIYCCSITWEPKTGSPRLEAKGWEPKAGSPRLIYQGGWERKTWVTCNAWSARHGAQEICSYLLKPKTERPESKAGSTRLAAQD